MACDVRESDLLLDLEDADQRITTRTKAVMPVHYAGNPGDLDSLQAWAQERGLKVVEDAAHAFGSEHQGRKVGTTGEVACFSFDSLKTITSGEGGAVICRDPEVARLVGLKRALGMDRKGATGAPGASPYDVVTQGWRYHMGNLCAAMGLVQLTKAPEFIARRREIARRYDQALAGLDGVITLRADYDQVTPVHLHHKGAGWAAAGAADTPAGSGHRVRSLLSGLPSAQPLPDGGAEPAHQPRGWTRRS